MRLKCIKLAGFKSFVDPAIANFPSNMAAVVGPNGCGKSNVIDAVRWVMGESSAKQLRGDSMTDVIFNGSGGRKPVNQASIELVFDNSSGRITGEYASYNEISVRRRVTRDGQSDYFLNSSKCRRRDILDIFLGTGLGPRSYSIIEQGMVSNLITARPEELRVYLEEAAGISKYKERRRETENRIKRTQENLERLTDLRDELGRQLQRLQRQSVAAEKYREYKSEERDLKTQLLALRWQALSNEVDSRQEQISEAELTVEKAVLGELECNNQIEKIRETHVQSQDAFNAIQASFYDAGEKIARIEQNIKNREEREKQLRDDIEQTQQSYSEATRHLEEDRRRAESWTAEVAELSRQKTEADSLVENAAVALKTADEAAVESQQKWDSFQQQSSETKRQAEVQQSSIQHLEQAIRALSERQQRLAAQSGDTGIQQLVSELGMSEKDQVALQTKVDEKIEAEQSQTDQVKATRDSLDELSSELDELRNSLQSSRGRMASLEALQEAALEDSDAATESWLVKQNLGTAQRLAESLQVDAGWETAAETVLGPSLKAVCVDSIDKYSAQLTSLQDGHLDIVESTDISKSGKYLSSKLSDGPARGLVSGVLVADDLAEALKVRPKLKTGESVITADGIWLGSNWCRVSRGDLTATGVLERKSEIETLSRQIASYEKEESEKRQQIETVQSQLLEVEEQQRTSRKESNILAGELSDVKAKISALSARKTELEVQAANNREETESIETQLKEQKEQLIDSRAKLADAMDLMEKQSTSLAELQAHRATSKRALDEARAAHAETARRVQQLEFREQTVATQLSSVNESIERLQQQLGRLDERRASLTQNSEKPDDDPLIAWREELEDRLEERLKVEHQMTEARQTLSDIEHQLQQLETQRQSTQQTLANARESLSNRRLQAQEVVTRRQTIVEQLGDTQPEQQLEKLPEDATEQGWQSKLEAMENRIQRLGPINLAAIEEYKTESERKEYLDAQNEELEQALETLQDAIKKIDRETRTRFKETFDKVNSGFKTLFPKLFGGGHAYLDLTSDDFLETGVTIMARPPGKRNSTIQLLSGGEKAMTAIALVFSIFQLNPAPFCMLDEVDAPLDDANCGRFANIVKEMSEKVQFIVITHNKITMEQANQLLGVTMHEPGVSRLVSVDVEEAIELAAV